MVHGDSGIYVARLFSGVRAGRQWLREAGPELNSLRFSGAFKMRAGGDDPPVFLIPGASGSILELGPIVSNLSIGNPVFAIAMKGIDSGELPDEGIEDIIDHSFRIITEFRRNGPYILVGYSFGGIVALETAQRLSNLGHSVPLVILLDSYPSTKVWPLYCRVEIHARKVRAWLASPSHLINCVRRRFRGLSAHLAPMLFGSLPPGLVTPRELGVTGRRVFGASLTALENYRPSPYSGKVVFIQPLSSRQGWPNTPTAVWKKYLANMETIGVPGSHATILNTTAIYAAAEISRVIEATRSELASAASTLPPMQTPRVSSPIARSAPKILDIWDRRGRFAFKNVIDDICRMAWDGLDSDEVMRIAKAYYYFSIQFRENLEIARSQFPDDEKLAELYAGECDTDNLSPWPGVAAAGERMNHDEFMRRLLTFHRVDRDEMLSEAGLAYLAKTRNIDDGARAASIASYEDTGLSRVFGAMLRAPHWGGKGQRAFRFFLEEHIRFDSDEGAGHGSLSRHLASDDRILPLWAAFRDLLVTAVPKLATVHAVTKRLPSAPTFGRRLRLV